MTQTYNLSIAMLNPSLLNLHSASLLYSQDSQLGCSDPEQMDDEGTACALIDLNAPVKGQIQGCARIL